MHHIRPAVEADLPSLLALAHTGNYINLPPFPQRLEQIVAMSRASFSAAKASATPPEGHERHRDRYLFVGKRDPESRAKFAKLIFVELLLLVGDVLAFTGFAESVAFDRPREYQHGRAFVAYGSVESSMDFDRVVPAKV